MRWVFAFLVPPVAILLCGKPIQFVFNLIVWLVSIPLLFFGIGFIVWGVCTIHALTLCKVAFVDKRMDRIVEALQTRSQTSPNDIQ
jgi:hypothetical protein